LAIDAGRKGFATKGKAEEGVGGMFRVYKNI